MPCFLVVTVQISDMVMARKAAAELGLVEGRDYRIVKDGVQVSSSLAGKLQQRYGILVSESLARRKGYAVQRKTQEDGTVQLTLRR